MSTDKRQTADAKPETEQQNGRPVFRGLHSETTDKVLGVFFEVYSELGGGFLESVYHEALKIAFVQANLSVAAEVPVPVAFRGQVVGLFRADLIVNDCVLLELKAI